MTVASYLRAVEPRQRAALERLRAAIRETAPVADECISYDMPAFRVKPSNERARSIRFLISSSES